MTSPSHGDAVSGSPARPRRGVLADGRPMVAFALGGLGGSNAHGAGFLHAAREEGVVPDLITCSSGQMHWAAAFLQGKSLPDLFKEHLKLVPEVPESLKPLTPVMLMLAGLPGVFRPSWHDAFKSMFGHPPPLNFNEFLNLILPARQMIPTRDPRFFREISECFNQSRTGVVFNSYNPVNGREYIHLNDRALELTHWKYDQHIGRRKVCRITPEYVEAGLWLMLYGFDRKFHGEFLVDGAYIRGTLLTECLAADSVFVPRALSKGWIGELPRNYFELMDFWTELLFQGTYAAEINAIELVNAGFDPEESLDGASACSPGLLAQWSNCRPIELIEIEISVQRGFFDYFTESQSVFERSHAESTSRIRQWKWDWRL